MDKTFYDNNLLSNRIPIFTSSQLDEARFGCSFPSRPPFNVYIGPRTPPTYPEISYGEDMPPPGTQYLLVTYTMPISNIEKQTFNNIESAIALDPQQSTPVQATPEVSMLSIDRAALLKRGVTLEPSEPQCVQQKKRKMNRTGKQMEKLRQGLLTEESDVEQCFTENTSCKVEAIDVNSGRKVPPITIRLKQGLRTADTPAAPVAINDSQSEDRTCRVSCSYTCDFCGSVQNNKSLTSEHFRKCTVRLDLRAKLLDREIQIPLERRIQRSYSPPNPFEILLRCMRNSI